MRKTQKSNPTRGLAYMKNSIKTAKMIKSDCDVDYLKIKAPATAANLGAGFDVFGMALEIPYDVIELETNDSLEILIKGKNAGDIPIPTEPLKNTAGFVASKLGCNVKITIHEGIVPGSGLGSSAAPAAGTVFGLKEKKLHQQWLMLLQRTG
jgi:homoserine kinase